MTKTEQERNLPSSPARSATLPPIVTHTHIKSIYIQSLSLSCVCVCVVVSCGSPKYHLSLLIHRKNQIRADLLGSETAREVVALENDLGRSDELHVTLHGCRCATRMPWQWFMVTRYASFMSAKEVFRVMQTGDMVGPGVNGHHGEQARAGADIEHTAGILVARRKGKER